MKSLLLATTLLILSSCVTVELSPEGQKVKTISPIIAQSCKHIGLTRGYFETALGAEILVRNQAASMGGNSLLPTSQGVSAEWYEIVAEVYKCD